MLNKTRPEWEGQDVDDIYDVFIQVYRRPGIDGNSKQIIKGNEVSIFTAVTSLLHTLYIRGICTREDLIEMAYLAGKSEEELESESERGV